MQRQGKYHVFKWIDTAGVVYLAASVGEPPRPPAGCVPCSDVPTIALTRDAAGAVLDVLRLTLAASGVRVVVLVAPDRIHRSGKSRRKRLEPRKVKHRTTPLIRKIVATGPGRVAGEPLKPAQPDNRGPQPRGETF
jgi:hypothetical protein